jgi:hypothetical protein
MARNLLEIYKINPKIRHQAREGSWKLYDSNLKMAFKISRDFPLKHLELRMHWARNADKFQMKIADGCFMEIFY